MGNSLRNETRSCDECEDYKKEQYKTRRRDRHKQKKTVGALSLHIRSSIRKSSNENKQET